MTKIGQCTKTLAPGPTAREQLIYLIAISLGIGQPQTLKRRSVFARSSVKCVELTIRAVGK